LKAATKGLSYPVLSKANEGNIGAMGKVLLHYEEYISKSSLRPVVDEHGNNYLAVDMELKGNIIVSIIQMILKFDMKVI
jgi:hypothetical protein